MQNRIFTQKLFLQAAAWAAVGLLVLLFFGKTILFFAVKAGVKIIGAVLLGFAFVFRKIFKSRKNTGG